MSDPSFLYLNRYSIEESHDEELADLVLGFVTKKISREHDAGIEFFRESSFSKVEIDLKRDKSPVRNVDL